MESEELNRQIRTRLAGLEAAGIEWLPRMDAPIAAVEMASTKLSETPSVAIADHGNSLDHRRRELRHVGRGSVPLHALSGTCGDANTNCVRRRPRWRRVVFRRRSAGRRRRPPGRAVRRRRRANAQSHHRRLRPAPRGHLHLQHSPLPAAGQPAAQARRSAPTAANIWSEPYGSLGPSSFAAGARSPRRTCCKPRPASHDCAASSTSSVIFPCSALFIRRHCSKAAVRKRRKTFGKT